DAVWTYGGRWDPSTIPAVLPFAAIPRPENGARLVDPAGVTLRWTPARNGSANRIYVGRVLNPSAAAKRPPSAADELRTRPTSSNAYDTGPLAPGPTSYWRTHH